MVPEVDQKVLDFVGHCVLLAVEFGVLIGVPRVTAELVIAVVVVILEK